MADTLPTIEGDSGGREAVPVVIFDTDGLPTSSSAAATGSKDTANSTEAELGSAAQFTGAWVTNNDPHIAFNIKADQPGELFLEFSPDGGTTVTLSKRYDIQAGEAKFDALVKGQGRSHRIRYVNGAVAQSAFVLLTITGSNLFPYSQSDRDDPVFAAYSAQDVTATSYAILIDLDDRSGFPHSEIGRIDLYASFLFVDRSSTATGSVQVGVITRVDGTNADISYVQGVSFDNASDRVISRDRLFTHPLILGQSGGALTRVASGFKETNVTAVNTGLPLPTPIGTANPAVGDVIVKFLHSAGTYDAAVSVQYAGDVSLS